jgi:hypothetical protein
MVQSVLVDVNEVRSAAAPEEVAALLRERIYGGIACLSTLLLLLRYPGEEPSAWPVVLDVVVATGSLWAASVLADLVAHMAAHGVAPRGAEAGRMFRMSGQILEAAVVPLVLLVVEAPPHRRGADRPRRPGRPPQDAGALSPRTA